MKYPALLAKINTYLSLFCGGLLFVIAAFAVFEAIARSVFQRPTIWTTDISTYMLLTALICGLAYTYQEKGHVAVDILRNVFIKVFGERGFKVIMFATYVISLVVVLVIVFGVWQLIQSTLRYNQLTNANIQIPEVVLYIIMLFGSVLMLATIVGIMLDIIGGNKKYIE